MNRISKNIAGVVLVAAVMTCGVNAAEETQGSAALAKIAALATAANKDLSAAAIKGDAAVTGSKNAIADAIKAIKLEADKVYAEMEAGTLAQEDAISTLDALVLAAENASKGKISDDLAEEVRQMRMAAGSGTFDSYDPPNMYNEPWTTATMTKIYEAHWSNLFASGRLDGGVKEGEATPE